MKCSSRWGQAQVLTARRTSRRTWPTPWSRGQQLPELKSSLRCLTEKALKTARDQLHRGNTRAPFDGPYRDFVAGHYCRHRRDRFQNMPVYDKFAAQC